MHLRLQLSVHIPSTLCILMLMSVFSAANPPVGESFCVSAITLTLMQKPERTSALGRPRVALTVCECVRPQVADGSGDHALPDRALRHGRPRLPRHRHIARADHAGPHRCPPLTTAPTHKARPRAIRGTWMAYYFLESAGTTLIPLSSFRAK